MTKTERDCSLETPTHTHTHRQTYTHTHKHPPQPPACHERSLCDWRNHLISLPLTAQPRRGQKAVTQSVWIGADHKLDYLKKMLLNVFTSDKLHPPSVTHDPSLQTWETLSRGLSPFFYFQLLSPPLYIYNENNFNSPRSLCVQTYDTFLNKKFEFQLYSLLR